MAKGKKRKVKRRSKARMYGPSIPAALLAQRNADSVTLAGMGPFIPAELLARRGADKTVLAAFKRLRKVGKKRKSKKSASPAQKRARAAFAARARKGGKKRPTKRRAAAKKPGCTPARKKARAGKTVTANQVIAMAKKGALQSWLCQGKVRTGCGSTGRVVSGKGKFSRLR